MKYYLSYRVLYFFKGRQLDKLERSSPPHLNQDLPWSISSIDYSAYRCSYSACENTCQFLSITHWPTAPLSIRVTQQVSIADRNGEL